MMDFGKDDLAMLLEAMQYLVAKVPDLDSGEDATTWIPRAEMLLRRLKDELALGDVPNFTTGAWHYEYGSIPNPMELRGTKDEQDALLMTIIYCTQRMISLRLAAQGL